MEKLKGFTTPETDDNSIILISVIKNEYLLLDYFIKYYSKIGITHFIFIDNDSSDDTIDYLLNLDLNILLFKTTDSYRDAKFGTVWVNNMLNTYCKDKWCIVLDIDEIIYNDNLLELRNQMEEQQSNVCKFYLLDMYPKNYDNEYIFIKIVIFL